MITVSSLPDRRIGSIHDLDPVNEFYGSLGDSGKSSGTDYYGRNYMMSQNNGQQQSQPQPPPQQQQQQQYHQQPLQQQQQQQQPQYQHHQQPLQQQQQQQPQQPKYQTPEYAYSNNQTQQQYNRNVMNGHQRTSGQNMGYTNDYTQNSLPEPQQDVSVRQQVRNSGVM